jgi:glutamyl-tRNA reductase
MIVGEPQILGQVKEAYRVASESGTTGTLLNKFFHRAFHVAKKLRSETAIGENPVSVSYAAVLLGRQIFGELKGKKALILGAGKMSESAVRHFKSAGISQLYVANRSPEKAAQLAREVDGEVIPFDRFEKWLVDVDIVLASTGSSQYLVGAEMVQEAMRHRSHRPMFFIDIAVPRNVSPAVNGLPNVYLYDIDDLGSLVEVNREGRLKEAERAAAFVEKEVLEFQRVLQSLKVVPTISSLTRKFDGICQRELEKVFQRLPQLDAAGREAVERMAYAIMSKILHDPMVALKEEDSERGQIDYANLLRKIFRLDEI